jgi:hypothetical protein
MAGHVHPTITKQARTSGTNTRKSHHRTYIVGGSSIENANPMVDTPMTLTDRSVTATIARWRISGS